VGQSTEMHDLRQRHCPIRSADALQKKRIEWAERLVRRSSQSEGGSDTHQLHLMEMMGFAGSTHPTRYALWTIY
jgi:hypothetical protein